jgi:hypothetical protein
MGSGASSPTKPGKPQQIITLPVNAKANAALSVKTPSSLQKIPLDINASEIDGDLQPPQREVVSPKIKGSIQSKVNPGVKNVKEESGLRGKGSSKDRAFEELKSGNFEDFLSVMDQNKLSLTIVSLERLNYYQKTLNNVSLAFESATLLHVAAERNNIDAVKWLLNKGFKVSSIQHS